ncbi:hypothetical protein [Tomitella biformata]|uniref:hypothetical protein n=1 Tax=Tomitella biformata TaxID=630403 RepID=UPI0004663D69|nr:hypothetical protein [Tomitella biformata]
MLNSLRKRRKPQRNPRRVLARSAAMIVLGGTGVAVTTFMGPAIADASATTLPEDPTARAAVVALLDASPAEAAAQIPADFAAVMEYTPVVADGMLTNPDGGCSSPVPLPSTFDTPCRAHDLGYDLLRLAELSGGPLGPWARQDIDAQFADRLHGLCDSSGCAAMANTAVTAVDVNSWRQLYAVPAREPIALYVLGGAGLSTLALLPISRKQAQAIY